MKKIIYIFIGCLLLTSCSGMLDIESHSAVSPGSVTSQDLSALRMGMYNKVQNSPTRESYITFDILGGDLTQSTGNAKDLINSVLSSLNSIVSNSWNGYYNALYPESSCIVRQKFSGDARNNAFHGRMISSIRSTSISVITANPSSGNPTSSIWSFQLV